MSTDEILRRIRRILAKSKYTVDDLTLLVGYMQALDFKLSTGEGAIPHPWLVAVPGRRS
jgi:hypothetical protein